MRMIRMIKRRKSKRTLRKKTRRRRLKLPKREARMHPGRKMK